MKKSYFSQPISLLSLLFLLFTFSSCDNKEEKGYTYFAGKIKNPKDKFVYLTKGKKILDSAKINDHHKFSFKIDSLELGLYTFKHGAEFQYLYLEPKDSLLLYLNTWDFDESLIFSGKGSAKNNYLINLYLEQEKVEKDFKHNYKLNEAEFSEVIDQGIKKELEAYNHFLSNEEEAPSEFFDKLVKTGIYVPFFFYKERYAYNHKKALGLDKAPELSDDFYDYRKLIELNDESLLDYSWNLAFINNFLYNLAHDEKMKDPENRIFELEFMKVVDNRIHVEDFKNSLLAKGVWGSLSNKNLSKEETDKVYAYFFENCSDEAYKAELKKSIAQKEKIACGEDFPTLTAYGVDNSEVEINKLIKDSNAVIYFWPTELGRIELLKEKLHYLEKHHPEVVFIGIERNKTDEEWKKFVSSKKLPEGSQFKLAKDSESYDWYEGDMARTIIVNNEGKVENGYVFFLDSNLNYYLKSINKH
ncbi:DUF4369 domain-containing protein [Lutimonas halocynthiae]|uniref:DUF4369 domain-containing protein n=1 Tax=Lutimonas halocynthiae TaxID=1446477 RepID=UPI0025B2E983|nr:DUF4369 domain-containing protein [Lutimonas halocynthiae]MDN3643567.1 DUF4369 domain-containing protein [Lutimonas halocynthiae]